jgi:hypothetical protein
MNKSKRYCAFLLVVIIFMAGCGRMSNAVFSQMPWCSVPVVRPGKFVGMRSDIGALKNQLRENHGGVIESSIGSVFNTAIFLAFFATDIVGDTVLFPFDARRDRSSEEICMSAFSRGLYRDFKGYLVGWNSNGTAIAWAKDSFVVEMLPERTAITSVYTDGMIVVTDAYAEAQKISAEPYQSYKKVVNELASVQRSLAACKGSLFDRSFIHFVDITPEDLKALICATDQLIKDIQAEIAMAKEKVALPVGSLLENDKDINQGL